jgi:hypothetical protein
MIVLFKELRNRVKRILDSRPSQTSPKGTQAPRSAGQARDDRASSVIELQKDVRALQQEITDLINARESGGIASGDPAHDARLASLRSRLTQKQADLAKFQARV